MRWTRLNPRGDSCCSENCMRTAKWRGESNGGEVASYWCSECRDAIDMAELEIAARAVVAFDWSDNDADAVAAIERLRRAGNN